MEVYRVAFVMFFLVNVLSYGANGDKDCQSCGKKHPQRHYCEADWVIKYESTSKGPAPLPGERDLGHYSYIFIRSSGIVQEVYKDIDGSLSKGDNDIYTPTAFCGAKFVSGVTYLLSGVYERTPTTNELYMKTTSCFLFMPWKKVSEEQKHGLKKKYGQLCGRCQIHEARTMDKNDLNDSPEGTGYKDAFSGYWTPYHECYFNPLTASQLRVEDCESQYSYCRVSQGECSWKLTDAYKSCFRKRELEVQIREGSRPAFTNRDDCGIITNKRLRRKCRKLVRG